MPRNVSYSMTFTFKGVDELTPASQKVQQGLQGTAAAAGALPGAVKPAAGSLKELAGAYNALIVARRGAMLIGTMLKPASDMADAMADMAIKTNVNAEGLDALRKAAHKAAAATPFTPAEATEAATELNMVMRDVNGTAQALIPTLQLASAYLGGNYAKAAEYASMLMGGFNMKASEMGAAMNKLVIAQEITGVQTDKMGEAFKKAGLIATTLQSNFDDVIPILYMATRGFRSGSAVTTGFLTGILRLADPKIGAMLENSLGVVTSVGGKLLPVQQIMLQLAQAAKDNKDNWTGFQHVLDQAFGKRAIKPFEAMLEAINKGLPQADGRVLTSTEIFSEFAKRFATDTTLLEDRAGTRMQTLSRQFSLLGDSAMNLSDAMFGPLTISLGYLLMPLTAVITAVADLISYIREMVPFAGVLLDVITRLAGTLVMVKLGMLAVAGISQIISVGLTWYTQLTTAAAGATTALGAALGGISRAALGWIGVLVTFATFLPQVLRWMGIIGKKDVKTTDEMNQKGITAAQRFTSAVDKTGQIMKDAQHTFTSFDAALTSWKYAIKAQLPQMPDDALKTFEKQIEAGIKRFNLAPDKAAMLRERMATARRAMTTEGRTDPRLAAEGQNALSLLALDIKGLGGMPAKQVDEAVKVLIEQMNLFREGSDAMARELAQLGVINEGYEKGMQNALNSAQANVLQSEAALKTIQHQLFTAVRNSAPDFVVKALEERVSTANAQLVKANAQVDKYLKELDKWNMMLVEGTAGVLASIGREGAPEDTGKGLMHATPLGASSTANDRRTAGQVLADIARGSAGSHKVLQSVDGKLGKMLDRLPAPAARPPYSSDEGVAHEQSMGAP